MRTYMLCLMFLLVMGWAACGDPQVQKETPANEVAADAGSLVDQAAESTKEAVADAGATEKQGEKAPDTSTSEATPEATPEATTPDKTTPDAQSTDSQLTEQPASEPIATPDEPAMTETSGGSDAALEPAPEQSVAEQAQADTPGPDLGPPLCSLPEDCKTVEMLFQQELGRIQACTQDSDCGKALAGTSCGCTRNKVAATNADLTCFEKLRKHGSTKGCDLGLISTCDCPPTNGFACKNNRCTWNYSNSP